MVSGGEDNIQLIDKMQQPYFYPHAVAENITLKIINCTAPKSVCAYEVMPKAYLLNQRQNDISDAGAILIESQKANAEDFTTAEQKQLTNIDTSQANWRREASPKEFLKNTPSDNCSADALVQEKLSNI